LRLNFPEFTAALDSLYIGPRLATVSQCTIVVDFKAHCGKTEQYDILQERGTHRCGLHSNETTTDHRPTWDISFVRECLSPGSPLLKRTR